MNVNSANFGCKVNWWGSETTVISDASDVTECILDKAYAIADQIFKHGDLAVKIVTHNPFLVSALLAGTALGGWALSDIEKYIQLQLGGKNQNIQTPADKSKLLYAAALKMGASLGLFASLMHLPIEYIVIPPELDVVSALYR